jgi:hypothetical protein
MNRIFAALIFSAAAIGAAHAGETDYLNNPASQVAAASKTSQTAPSTPSNPAGGTFVNG